MTKTYSALFTGKSVSGVSLGKFLNEEKLGKSFNPDNPLTVILIDWNYFVLRNTEHFKSGNIQFYYEAVEGIEINLSKEDREYYVQEKVLRDWDDVESNFEYLRIEEPENILLRKMIEHTLIKGR